MSFPLQHSTLIIGAGAHVPYGLPTSLKLTQLIKNIYKDPYVISDIKRFGRNESHSAEATRKNTLAGLGKLLGIVSEPKLQFSINEYDLLLGKSLNSFLCAFCESGVYSIDRYLSKLDQMPDRVMASVYEKWGKLIISFLISDSERAIKFGCHQNDWIQFIINRYIGKDYTAFFKNPPKIITFNYDRFLEQCLFKNLTQYHHIPVADAKAMIEGLPILHVYGQLGHFQSWEPIDLKKFYVDATSSIQVVGSHRSDKYEETKSKIREVILNSVKIYFLGYGYDDLNNKLLFEGLDKNWYKQCDIFSTNIGIQTTDSNAIADSLYFTPDYIMSQSVDVLTLLKDLEPLEKKTTK